MGEEVQSPNTSLCYSLMCCYSTALELHYYSSCTSLESSALLIVYYSTINGSARVGAVKALVIAPRDTNSPSFRQNIRGWKLKLVLK